jgi:hypothetical protein
VLLRDSTKREQRIESIAECAIENGASSSVVDRVRDVAEELITNAMYDAPAERAGRPAVRTADVMLDKRDACTVTYGASRGVFMIRVRDQCGSLRRDRLFQVLRRCAVHGDVPLDTRTGGAGLGMWRILNSSSLTVIHVSPGRSTEFVIGIDLTRARRATRGRAIFLFFDEPASDGSGRAVTV